MSEQITAWAVIPARGGSKGVPWKCGREVGGVPLLVRSVRAALQAQTITRVLVSTDDSGFAALATKNGAEVPFLRPPALATDTASVVDAVMHLLERLKADEGATPDFVVLLQPTSPFVVGADIDGAFNVLGSDTDAAVSVCETEVLPDWLRVTDENGWLKPPLGLNTSQHTPRQMMQKVYRLNGAVYWVRTAAFLDTRTFLPPRTVPFVMPRQRSVDIDTIEDIEHANWLAEKGGW